jgi:hypothetical protein
MAIDGIEAGNGAVVVNDTLGISLRRDAPKETENVQPSLLQRLLGFFEEEEVEAEDCAKGYACWTCGASYETSRAREFLMHIKECCKT